MLGAEDILRSRIQPDYSLTVNEVFLGNARAIPETSWNLDLFSAVDPITSEVLDGKSTTFKRLPTWVPDSRSGRAIKKGVGHTF